MTWYFGDTIRLKTSQITRESFCIGITKEFEESKLLVLIKGHQEHGAYRPMYIGETFYERCRLVLTEKTSEAIVAWEESNQGKRLQLEPHEI